MVQPMYLGSENRLFYFLLGQEQKRLKTTQYTPECESALMNGLLTKISGKLGFLFSTFAIFAD